MLELAITNTSAAWFLPFAIPIAIWVSYSDMKYMKIPNKAVMALFGVFVIVGLIALPLADYPWRFLHLAVVLLIGFLLNALGLIGAGDAKFAAVMAPFVSYGDIFIMFYVFFGTVIIAYLLHRLFQRIPAFRKLTPDWQSWDNKDFPMGLALGGSLAAYLTLGAFS